MFSTDDWTARWNEAWPEVRPIGYELREGASQRWIRFHSLPGSRRYPEAEDDFHELLLRHNAVIEELFERHRRLEGESLVVVAPSWSESPQPDVDSRAIPGLGISGSYWLSLTEDDEIWTHQYVGELTWRVGCLDRLLRLVATDKASGVIVTTPTLRWLYHPYDGGADVIVSSLEERQDLVARHPGWLPKDGYPGAP